MKQITVNDPAFAAFGRVIAGVPMEPLLAVLSRQTLPEEGMVYQPREDALHGEVYFTPWGAQLFADMPYQLGHCCGSNETADCLVCHGGSAFVISPQPFALLAAPRGGQGKGALRVQVPANTLTEIYGDTLRSAPLGRDFRVLVLLPYATNTGFRPENPLDAALFARNTWRYPVVP